MSSDRADKSDLGDETPWGRGPRELAVAAKERERVLAQNAQEIRKLGKRASADVIEIGRRLTEMKKICGHAARSGMRTPSPVDSPRPQSTIHRPSDGTAIDAACRWRSGEFSWARAASSACHTGNAVGHCR